MLRSLLLLLCALSLTVGCDAIDDAVNDALPEVTISEGVLGLNGSDGTELSGSFSATTSASKQAAVATLNLTRAFDDYDSGEGTISSFVSSLGLPAYEDGSFFRITEPANGTFPDAISISTGVVSLTITVRDLQSSQELTIPVTGTAVFVPPLNRLGALASCDGSPCAAYSTPDIAEEAARMFRINIQAGADLDRLQAIVFGECEGANCNQVEATLTIGITNDAADVAGARLFTKLGEVETTVQPQVN